MYTYVCIYMNTLIYDALVGNANLKLFSAQVLISVRIRSLTHCFLYIRTTWLSGISTLTISAALRLVRIPRPQYLVASQWQCVPRCCKKYECILRECTCKLDCNADVFRVSFHLSTFLLCPPSHGFSLFQTVLPCLCFWRDASGLDLSHSEMYLFGQCIVTL